MLQQLTARILAFVLAAGVMTVAYQQAASVPSDQLVAQTVTTVAATETAATRLRRVRWNAMGWARTQRGKRYCWGGTGPSCYDCSGLVMKAYTRAGVQLPRTAADIRYSGKFRRISAANARWGDLVFWGVGHVEFYSHRHNGVRYSFGSHHSGTTIGWRKLYGSPAFYTLR